MSVTLSKLSVRNAKRQARDYLVYFITIIMTAALVYAFNGIVFSSEIHSLGSMMASLPLIIVFASIVVVGIMGWLVSYTTGFMLRKRSRELGTYILLGLETKQVAKLFFMENLAVGGVALVFGVALGNLVFQALRAVMLTLFSVPYTFSFSFSLGAVLLTLVYFALIYLFALTRSRKRIGKMKIYDLLNLDKQNQGEVIKKSKNRKRIFTVSIILGVIGTVFLVTRNLALGLIGATMIILFLFGFFLSFSSGVPEYFNKRPIKKYSKQNLIVFRSLSSKLATMGVIMATIALLFTATLIAEGTGFVFSTIFEDRKEYTTCFDVFISTDSTSEDHFDPYMTYIDENILVNSEYRYTIYKGENDRLTRHVQGKADYWVEFDYDCVMTQGKYAALRDMLGYPKADVESGQYIIHCMSYIEDIFDDNTGDITIGDTTLQYGAVYSESFSQSMWGGNGRGFIIVVPDELVLSLTASHQIYAAMSDVPVTDQNGFKDLQEIRYTIDGRRGNYDTLFAKGALEEESASMYAMTVFPLFYLALVLTMAAATILTIQLLSESAHYRRQYALLDKLGMDRREMKKALFRQFAIFYTMPALPPIAISVPFIMGLGSILDPGVISGPFQLWGVVGIALGLFLAIYLTYILAAYTSFRRGVLPD